MSADELADNMSQPIAKIAITKNPSRETLFLIEFLLVGSES